MANRCYIPPKVHFFLQPKQNLEVVTGRNYRLHQQKEVPSCQPAFPVSSLLKPDAMTWHNAKEWATPWPQGRTTPYSLSEIMHFKQRGVEPPPLAGPPGDPEEVILDNTPKGGYRIVGAEQRGEGGRAWLVLTPENYLVDLREDVFLPILLTKGLPASGIIDAEFQWCANGGHLRLEEVGSAQHSEYTPAEDVEDLKKKKAAASKTTKKSHIQVKDLVVGATYEFNRFGREDKIYLGKVRKGDKVRTMWEECSRFHKGGFQIRTGSQALARVGNQIIEVGDIKDYIQQRPHYHIFNGNFEKVYRTDIEFL